MGNLATQAEANASVAVHYVTTPYALIRHRAVGMSERQNEAGQQPQNLLVRVNVPVNLETVTMQNIVEET